MTSATNPHRALTETEVGTIFDSVHKSLKPPPHLAFQVIPIPSSKGGKISPPKLKFEDGIYLICDITNPTFPEHLRTFVAKEPLPALPKSEYWSPTGGALRGKNDMYRVRYCYNHRISVSGFLWTKIVDNNEDLQYRFLHVFPTPPSSTTTTKKKRARNIKTTTASSNDLSETPATKKKKPSSPSSNKECERSLEKTTDTTSLGKLVMSPQSLLTQTDVSTIFDCLHGSDKELPPNLKFQVVPAGSSDRKLSPPPLHFEDGLYVLCETVPDHLLQHVGESSPRPSSISWRPSGPTGSQSFKPFKFRHCYPIVGSNGTKRFKRKGFLWTKVVNGREDLKYRLFLVAPSPTTPDAKTASQTDRRASKSATKRKRQKQKSRSTSPTGAATVTPGMQQTTRTRVGRSIARPKRFDDRSDPVGSDHHAQAMPTPKQVHYTLIKYQKDVEGDGIHSLDNRLGFVMLQSRAATFAVLRAAIEDDVDPGDDFKFFLPSLGPVSKKQEENLGSVADFLGRSFNGKFGDGSPDSPFRLTLSFS